MCCFFNKAYLRIPFDIIKKPKVILLYHCWNHVLFSFIVVKDAASHRTNYSLPRGGGYVPKKSRLVNEGMLQHNILFLYTSQKLTSVSSKGNHFNKERIVETKHHFKRDMRYFSGRYLTFH